ncbi:MAG TPA: tryptophan--tRNA ligase [Planctomycetota bacterium]|nr:tryptophan--tRNA ligase [Planctomycetota bacterium]
MTTKGRILSGMRPTGQLHLGHVIGALRNWVELQSAYDCFYFVADHHALMSEYSHPEVIRESTLNNVADWIACGVDPDQATVFVQSHVPEHAELHVVLSAITPLGWLERCPTYKEQLVELEKGGKDVRNYAFLGYPVLQAADIIMYKANYVPVGEDQIPHLELTREIVRRFNGTFCKAGGEIFPEPQPKLTAVPRLLGLDRRKMSKSYGNAIFLSDPAEEVAKKIATMYTDPKRVRRADPGHPEECNVHDYYLAFAPERAAEVADKCRSAAWGCTDCKKDLAATLNAFLDPIRAKRTELLGDKAALERILRAGNERARAVAAATMKEVRLAVGYWGF